MIKLMVILILRISLLIFTCIVIVLVIIGFPC